MGSLGVTQLPVVSWSLTSLFSTNMAISEMKELHKVIGNGTIR